MFVRLTASSRAHMRRNDRCCVTQEPFRYSRDGVREIEGRWILRLHLNVTGIEAGRITRGEWRGERNDDQNDETDRRGTSSTTAARAQGRSQPTVQHALAALSNRVPDGEKACDQSAHDGSAFCVHDPRSV